MSKRIPSYRQHKPSGQAVVTLSGKDHYLGPWQSEVSRAEYDRLVAEWLTSGRQFVSSFDEITVVELIAKYLEFAKVYYANDGETTSEYTCMRDSVRVWPKKSNNHKALWKFGLRLYSSSLSRSTRRDVTGSRHRCPLILTISAYRDHSQTR